MFIIVLMSEETKKEEGALGALNDKLLKTRSVMLSGEISKESAEQVIKSLLVLDSESAEAITLYIDSPGGDVDAGFAIYDIIRFINSPVTIVGVGLVASAAALVLLAVPPERRVALPNSTYLIHQPLTSLKGVATDIKIHADLISKLRTRLDALIAEATGKSAEEVASDTERDHFLTAEEAFAYNLVSRIVEKKSEL